VGHGETYLNPEDILWWSKGGVLHGQSPPRLAFLRKILDQGPPEGLEPLDKWQDPRIAGKKGAYYLVSFGRETPTEWLFELPRAGLNEPLTLRAEVIDTWNMTTTPVDGLFEARPRGSYLYVCEERPRIELPGKPYVVLRLTRAVAR
jgi:hypothetical protein